MEFIKKWLHDWRVLLALCLTVGLSPFWPEPHIWGKYKWIKGGAHAMGWIDWLDLAWHLWPWLLMIWWLNRQFSKA